MKITAQHISFSYDNESVLKDISFDLDSDIVAIVGASGCGKSTLLKLLSGSLTPQGCLLINDNSAKQNTQQGKVSYMFQERALFPNLSVLQNVMLPLKIKGIKDTSKAVALLGKVGLSDYHNFLPSQLSGGMKTRVELARTFVTNPELILMDEPFSDLDVRWKDILYKELETLRKEYGATLVWVTHDINEALLLSNRIIVMGAGGRLLKDVQIEKELPRVYSEDAIFSMEKEHLLIRELIMNDQA